MTLVRLLGLGLLCSGCGLFAKSSADAGSDPCVSDPTVSITVQPSMATMKPGDRLTFTWDIRSRRGSAIAEPSFPAGSLDPAGQNAVWLNAPATPGTYTLDVVRIGCPADVGRATITVQPLADPGPAPGQQPVPTAVAWSPDGTRLAVGGRGGVWLFDTTNRFLDSVKLPHQGALTVAFSPDGARLAVGGDVAAPAWVLQASGLQPWSTVGGPGAGGVLFSRDGQTLYVLKGDRVLAVTLADGKTREVSPVTQTTVGQTDAVPRLEHGPLDSLLVTVPGELRELSTGRRMTRWTGGSPLDGVIVAPDASWVLTANTGLHFPFFPAPDVSGGGGGGGGFFTAERSPDGLIALGKVGAVAVVRVENGQLVELGGATLPGAPGKVLDVAWSPDGARLAVAGSTKHFIFTRAELGL